MYIYGSLYANLQNRMERRPNIALLIIDEHRDAIVDQFSNAPGLLFHNLKETKDAKITISSNITARQQRILMCMQTMNYPVFSINTDDPNDDCFDPTRSELRGLYIMRHYSIRKPMGNAFAKTILTQLLDDLRVKILVIMGWDANVCVASTIGVSTIKQIYFGALQRGFTVMTCDQILHGEAANWAFEDSAYSSKLEFYSQF